MRRWRHGAGRRHRRDRKRYPGIPSRRAVLCLEFAIGFHVEVSLHVADGKQEAGLGPDAEHARTKTTEDRMLANIVGDLLICVPDQYNEELLGKELRHS